MNLGEHVPDLLKGGAPQPSPRLLGRRGSLKKGAIAPTVLEQEP